jgi:hypothetical protein
VKNYKLPPPYEYPEPSTHQQPFSLRVTAWREKLCELSTRTARVAGPTAIRGYLLRNDSKKRTFSGLPASGIASQDTCRQLTFHSGLPQLPLWWIEHGKCCSRHPLVHASISAVKAYRLTSRAPSLAHPPPLSTRFSTLPDAGTPCGQSVDGSSRPGTNQGSETPLALPRLIDFSDPCRTCKSL